jgi:hypothetical protein
VVAAKLSLGSLLIARIWQRRAQVLVAWGPGRSSNRGIARPRVEFAPTAALAPGWGPLMASMYS